MQVREGGDSGQWSPKRVGTSRAAPPVSASRRKTHPATLAEVCLGWDVQGSSPPPTPGQGQQGARHTLKNEATPSLLFNVFLLFLAVVLNLHEVGVREWIK